VPVEREVLVEPPARRDVVDDHVGDRVAAQRIVASPEVSPPEAQVTEDDVVGVDVHALAPDADAVAGGRLAGDRQERVVDLQRGLQGDEARHAEDDGPRPLRLDRRAQAPRPAVVQVRDEADLAPAPPRRPRPRTLGAGERGDPRPSPLARFDPLQPPSRREEQEDKAGGDRGFRWSGMSRYP
jgi:hypothetical protein